MCCFTLQLQLLALPPMLLQYMLLLMLLWWLRANLWLLVIGERSRNAESAVVSYAHRQLLFQQSACAV